MVEQRVVLEHESDLPFLEAEHERVDVVDEHLA